jgi:hypothetical protein
MTMIDDDFLATLFTQAGDAFDVPASGSADILERASGGADLGEASDEAADDLATVALSRRRRVMRTVRTHRVLSVAASLVVVLVIAGAAVGLGGSSAKPPVTSASSARPGTPAHSPVSASTPSTTTPTPLGAPAPAFSAGGSTASGTSAGAGTSAASGAGGTPSLGGTTGQVPNSASSAPANGASSLPEGVVGQSAKIEQTGDLSLTVGKGDLSKTMSQLTFLASLYNGFVATSQTESGNTSVEGAPNGSITLQVPVADFADVLKKAQSLGKTTSLTTKATDVTGQYVDLQSRITALQDSRQQYLTIMAKATSVGDVLAVQAQLDTIQQEIEQLQGQLQVLTSETAYSTVTVTVSEGSPPHYVVSTPHQSGHRGPDPGGRSAPLRPASSGRAVPGRPPPLAALPAPQSVEVRRRGRPPSESPASSLRPGSPTAPRPR